MKPIDIAFALRKAIKTAKLVDELENISFKQRAREKKSGSTDCIMDEFRKKAFSAYNYSGIYALIKDTKQKLLSVETSKEKETLKVMVVGEIFSLNDDYANLNLF